MQRPRPAGGLSSGTILAAGLLVVATAAALIALKYRKFEPRESATQPATAPAPALGK